MPLTPGSEDYLKAVYEISLQKKVVRIKDLAEKLQVKTSSVVSAMKTLASKDLLVHEHYGYIELTKEGKRLGKEISQRHYILQMFLQKILLLDEDTASSDACNIEHHLDKKTVKRIIKLLDFISINHEDQPQFLINFEKFLTEENCFEPVLN